MSQNWMRHFELLILGDEGKGISLSDFKVTFDIDWYNLKYPSTANIKIYNLSQNTQSRIMGKEFSKVRIIAGYDGLTPNVNASEVGVARTVDGTQASQSEGQNIGLIYSGDIRFTLTGKDNPTDTWVMLQVCDGLNAFINAHISATLSKGYTVEDVYNLLLRYLEPHGIIAGRKPKFPSTVFPRGKTFYGRVSDYLDNVAKQCGATWQFYNGRLDMMNPDMVAHSAIVLNSNTGLVGMPQQTIGTGVNIRCLINPNILINGLIHLDQKSVYRTQLASGDIQGGSGRFNEMDENGNQVVSSLVKDENGNPLAMPPVSQPASLATDGVYVVKSIRYTGDTRGNPWYMDMMCEARDAADLKTKSAFDRMA